MRFLFLLLFAVILSASSWAGIVTQQEAGMLAKNFLIEHNDQFQSTSQIIFSEELIISDTNQPLIYVFNVENHQGFIMVSAESDAYPVLAYSFQGSYNPSNTSPAFDDWIDNYKSQLKYISGNQFKRTKAIQNAWNGNFSSKSKSSKSISPLVTTKWGQGCYYNDSCPVDIGGPCGHVVTGCVATAMAQVINYYDFPSNGSGSHSYMSSYGLLTANYGNTTYNWNNMSDTLTSNSSSGEIASVAQLISHCGISVEMMYGAGSSGAYSIDAEKALVHYFNFSPDLVMKEKINYPDSVWEEMIRQNLDSLLPLYYSGSGSAGHAFVCDGYDGTDYFHFNWGWNGANDGYYYVSNLNPSGMNFSQYQAAIFNIKPAVSKSCSGSTMLTNAKGNISDGSVSQNYFHNSNCTWTIQPAVGESITLDFYTFDVDNSDVVNIYDGNSTSANLINSFTGNTLPVQVSSTVPAMTIEFVTDNTLNGQGWSASYITNFCKGYSVLTATADTINDGSGSFAYNDNTDCHWLIQPTGANTIHLEFLNFKTELGFDYLTVYDGNSPSANVLGTYDGHNLPPLISSTGGAMYLQFTSDGGVVDDGFTAVYSACFDVPEIDTGTVAAFCQGDSLLLKVPSIFQNYQWQYSGIDIPGETDSLLYAKQAGDYSVIVSSQYCPSDTSKEVSIISYQNPSVFLGNDTILCENHNLILNAGSGFNSYLWNFGDTLQQVAIDTSLFGLGANNYIVTVTDNNGCKASDTVNVTFILCTSIEELNLLKIYPNPTIGQLEISFTEIPVQLSVTDLSGRILINRNVFPSNKEIVDLSRLPNGIYLLKAEYPDKNETFKVVLQKSRP